MTASRLAGFLLVTGALLAAAVAQAQNPKAADDKAAQAQPVKAVAAQKPAGPSPQLLRDARNAGFRPETIRGAQMFCRTEKELGSNFPVRTCYDEDQVKIKIEQYQAERNQLQQMHGSGLKGN
jgi:hypothetical protein